MLILCKWVKVAEEALKKGYETCHKLVFLGVKKTSFLGDKIFFGFHPYFTVILNAQ